MKKQHSVLKALVILLIIALLTTMMPVGAVTASAASKSNGSFIVELWNGSTYEQVASFSADEFQKEFKVSIGDTTDPQLRIRKAAEGLAFLDNVFVDDIAADNNKKLLKTDFDVQEVTTEGIVLQFYGSFGGDLSLTGRIEPKVIVGNPFMFPFNNTYIENPQEFEAFMAYTLGSNPHAVRVDGQYEDQGDAFESRYLVSATGHPDGYAYIYVSNDDEYLYASADFTGDNTFDYGEDFFKVFAKVDGVVKEFKQTSDGREYGAAAMQYTDKVAYEHMYYEIKIPLGQLGGTDELQLAFSLYGTAAITNVVSNPASLTFTAGQTANGILRIANFAVYSTGTLAGFEATFPGLDVQFQIPSPVVIQDGGYVDVPYTVQCATPGSYTITVTGMTPDQYTIPILPVLTIPVQVDAPPTITGLPDTYTLYTSGRVTWDPQPSGGTWDYDETFFSATIDGSATFKALKAGTSTVTYSVSGVSKSVAVTIQKSNLPSTGQDFTWVYVLAGVGACLTAAAGILYGKRKARV